MLIKELNIENQGDFIKYRPEVIEKVIKEVLSLYRLPLYDETEERTKNWFKYAKGERPPVPDGEVWAVRNEINFAANPLFNGTPLAPRVSGSVVSDDGISVTTNFSRDGKSGEPITDYSSAGEDLKAAVHRLAKLNFYRAARRDLSLPAAPWGIFHGVRPTKIVHNAIERGQTKEEIIDFLRANYAVGAEKAALITDIAFRQRPFLADTDSQRISLYIGIPFCPSRCLYCSFPAYVLPPRPRLNEFLRILYRDLAAAKAAIDRYGFRVANIYLGGGTPTSLPDGDFADLLSFVEKNFYSKETKEITVEAGRPDSLTFGKIAAMTRHKVARVSLNPQTMQARTLEFIGRQHTPRDIVAMYHLLRAIGDFSINMDLIIGLPTETAADVADTLAQIAVLKPDDITLHALALKRGSRLALHKDEIKLPSDDEAQEMSAVAQAAIAAQGLSPYYLYRQGYQRGELENIGFCRSQHESRYNIEIMEERQTIIGCGGAATTKVVDPATGIMKASFNPKELSIYIEKIDSYIAKRNVLLETIYGNHK